MNQEKILNAVSDACQDDTLHFQIIIQDKILYIYINREDDAELDDENLTNTISSAITDLGFPELEQIYLYSRLLGETEPDWQTIIELENSVLASIEDSIAELNHELGFDISESFIEQDENNIESLESSEAIKESIELNQDDDSVLVDNESENIVEDLESIKATEESIELNQDDDSVLVDEESENNIETLESIEATEAPIIFNKESINFNRYDNLRSVNNENNNIIENEITQDTEDIKEPKLDLSNYCFIRNKRLLTADIVAPKYNIAQLINNFDKFNNSIKEQQILLIDNYFQKSEKPDLTDFEPEIETWWNEVLEFSGDEYRKIAIWLSRYCLDSEQTLSIVETVFAAKAEIEAAKKQAAAEAAEKDNKTDSEDKSETNSPTEYSQTSQPKKQVLPQNRVNTNPSNKRTSKPQSKSKFSLPINKILPIVWIIITIAIVIYDINNYSQALPVVCKNITGETQAYCHLAVEMVGEEALTSIIENPAPPLEDTDYITEDYIIGKGLENCQIYGNIAAGIPLKEAKPYDNPLLKESTAVILPDFYVADVEQTNLKEGKPTVRTACFFYRVQKLSGRNDIKFLVMDRIDSDWPEVAYEPSERIKSTHSLNKTIRAYSFLSIFGVNTFFTAVAIYFVAICGMAISVYSIENIYKASFILGIVESILSFLPVGGFIKIPLECIALGITSGCVKGFKIDWAAGYPFVAATALLLIAFRALVSWLFLGLLFAIFS